jgi:hypothetical protein
MKIATSWSTAPDTDSAVTVAYQKLVEQLAADPQLVFLHSSAAYDSEVLVRRLQEMAPNVPVHGGTSCLGVMTEIGFHSDDGLGLGMFGILDPEGSYGVGVARTGDDPRTAVTNAAQQALERAHRPGEVPATAWITAAPGQEEALIQGIEDLFGSNVPVAGGSSGDNTVAGEWKQFANGQVYQDAVVVTTLFPSTEVMFTFHSGYEPSDRKGRVTRAEGRVLHEIEGRPAAQVYNEWTGGVISDTLAAGGNVLTQTTLYPLGRVVGRVGGAPYFRLSHPDSVTPEGALTLFTDMEKGAEIILMRGTRESLVTRAGHVAQSVLDTYSATTSEIAGALVVYCAGCMLTVQDRMNEVIANLRSALGEKPFLGMFTFGEQGCFIGGENRHGNLMISVLIFGA